MEETFMELALEQAKKALSLNEVPIGAVIVRHGEIISQAHNMRETLKDPTAHAEMIAIRRAASKLGGWRLMDCSIYVTVEPCSMCTSAIIQSRISNIVFALAEPKTGAIISKVNLPQLFNHKIAFKQGVLEEKSKALMQDFFSKLRR